MTSLKDPRIRFELPALTPRQRQVMRLIEQGRTNGEIGAALGISLDGAKWHVSEILGRLGVDSREQAVVVWRSYNRPSARFARIVRGFVPAAVWAKWVAAGAGCAALAAVAAVAIVAVRQGPSLPLAAASASPTATGSPATSSASPSVSPTRYAVATAPSQTIETPAATVTQAPSPAPSAAPAPPRISGVSVVDRAIDALQRRDYGSLGTMLLTSTKVCGVTPDADSWAFDCPAGVRAGTSLAVYTLAGCDHPTYLAASTASTSLPTIVSGVPAVYAVTRNPDGTYRAIFRDSDPNALTLTLTSSGISTVGRACGVSAADVFASSSSTVLAGPFE